MPSPLAAHFTLDEGITFLNHGSFGACPRAVQDAQRALRERLEREPVDFFLRFAGEALADARDALGAFLGADPADLAFVSNATAGINAVLRSLDLAPGDELLVTDHEYQATRNALDFVARRSGARVVVVPLPFPTASADALVEPLLAAVTDRTRLALLDHVTSATGLVLPIARLVAALAERGVDCLVDAAHAPGMVDVQLDATGAAYTTGNCHKWLCAPKGAAFLHVRRDRQPGVRPLSISHGASATVPCGSSRFRIEFDWTGTDDPTAWLCVPVAIETLGALVPGGWPALRARNHALAVETRRVVCDALGVPVPTPDDLIGTLGAVPLPRPPQGDPPPDPDPLHRRLWEAHRIEVPVFPWRALGQRILRTSSAAYNDIADARRLAEALVTEGEAA